MTLIQFNLFPDQSPFPGRQVKNGVELFVRAIPKATNARIGPIFLASNHVAWLKVYVTAIPEDNQANEAIIELLAAHFDYPKSKIKLTAGATHRQKTLLLHGADLADLKKLLG